ncbi:uncharacterized protein N7443_004749 [Penicillium atrosanguineum]|uniref:Uncharacterized protein n=1 Tax=Penicillium atrosanguineum TaxID=1132637 RepID=A0A9W9U8V1_9EURO|nr:uncharacterized protein N7443_004749 [Penicillium atrosanguineum]KAJ5133628.1 hypothetical protein N7526_004993 [Penicillium atrosanguineum]KAJ5305089.1 hypothetical protein N7443_004749 [Penicillium atrosanguineum]KAJ5324557.1 hypothetical protein N7476_003157 [Penicillium atrosanguineum]
MPYKLHGRNVLIVGGARGLGVSIAEKFAAEGCNVAINYLSSHQQADDLALRLEKDYDIKTTTIQGDAGIQADCVRLIRTAIEKFKGLDIIISNAGWTRFSNFEDLYALDENEWDKVRRINSTSDLGSNITYPKCWATNVKSNLFLFREALPTFNANEEGGVFITTSSIAVRLEIYPFEENDKFSDRYFQGITPSGSSMAYSASQGPKVRINSVLPGLLLTEWILKGLQYSAEQIQSWTEKSALKHEVSSRLLRLVLEFPLINTTI